MYSCILKKDIPIWGKANRAGMRRKIGTARAGMRVTGGSPFLGAWVQLYTPAGWTKASKLPREYAQIVTNPPPPVAPRLALLPLYSFAAWQDAVLDAHPNIRRVRKWGDPVLVAGMGASVDLVGTSNFQAVGLYNKSTGFGGVTNFLHIPHDDVMWLSRLQVEDVYQDKSPDWLTQKMRWLYSDRGRMYMAESVEHAQEWDNIQSIRWGTIALGGNLVNVEGYEEIKCKYKNEETAKVHLMARLAGMRRADMTKPFDTLLAEGLIHRCLCAYTNNQLGDTPKGIVYSPFWSLLDWDFAGMDKPESLYIPAEWLE